jgi:dynactin complex subunit
MKIFVDSQAGSIKYVGKTKFAKKNVWLGLELDKPTGKNDGSVKGVRYFNTKPSHGLFVGVDEFVLIDKVQANKLMAGNQALLGKKFIYT